MEVQVQLLCFFRCQVGEEMADQRFAVAEVLEVGLGVFAE
jgi:hypothetical protein